MGWDARYCRGVRQLSECAMPSRAHRPLQLSASTSSLCSAKTQKTKVVRKSKKIKASARGFICLMSNSTDDVDMRDCPGVRRIHAGAQLRRAAALHEKRVIRSGVMSYNPAYIRRMSKVLFK